jgi:hypothetical protein
MSFLRSAAGFVAGFVASAVATIVVFGSGRGGAAPSGDPAAGSLAMAAYLILMTSLPAAAGFASVTCVSRRWRELSGRMLVGIAAACGFLCYAALLTGLVGFPAVVAPFPLGAVGAAIRLIAPGVALGLLALATSTWRARRTHIGQS